MLLDDRTAIVHGAGGAIGGAVAAAFAREGARVFLAGRTRSAVEAVAGKIRAGGGTAEVSEVDALDERAVDEHADQVAEQAGRIDVCFTAIGIPQRGVQGVPLLQMSPEAFTRPIETYARSQFLTARAAGRHMAEAGSGVIMTLTAAPARLAVPLVGGMAPAWSAVEALTRGLAAELGPLGVRVVGLRPDGIPETTTVEEVYGLHAEGAGMPREEFTALMVAQTHLRRLPTLAEVAGVATFLASDGAGAMTGTIANVSSGAVAE